MQTVRPHANMAASRQNHLGLSLCHEQAGSSLFSCRFSEITESYSR